MNFNIKNDVDNILSFDFKYPGEEVLIVQKTNDGQIHFEKIDTQTWLNAIKEASKDFSSSTLQAHNRTELAKNIKAFVKGNIQQFSNEDTKKLLVKITGLTEKALYGPDSENQKSQQRGAFFEAEQILYSKLNPQQNKKDDLR